MNLHHRIAPRRWIWIALAAALAGYCVRVAFLEQRTCWFTSTPVDAWLPLWVYTLMLVVECLGHTSVWLPVLLLISRLGYVPSLRVHIGLTCAMFGGIFLILWLGYTASWVLREGGSIVWSLGYFWSSAAKFALAIAAAFHLLVWMFRRTEN